MSKLQGYFISFEGGDGSGKTTQSRLLQKYLKDKLNIEACWTREPGGSNIGNDVRELLAKYSQELDGYSTLLLLMASRRQHINKLIIPNIAKGNWVICDRFIDSTLAYQNVLDGISYDFIIKAHKEFAIDYWPYLTFFLDITPEIASMRMSQRSKDDYYDNLDMNKKTNLRESFLQIAKIYPERIHIIDGSKSEQDIHIDIVNIINKKLLNND